MTDRRLPVSEEAELLRTSLLTARAVTGADNATFAVPDVEEGYVRVIASATDDPNQLWQSRFALRDGVAGQVAATGETIVLNEASRSPQFRTLGSRTIESILAIPVDVAGQLRGIITVTSAHRHAFASDSVNLLTLVSKQLGAALALAQRAAWGRQLAGLAHDLNTPLSSIRGFLSLVHEQEDEIQPTQLREYLQLAAVATEQLVHLVGDMRDILSLSHQKLRLRPGPFHPGELARVVTGTLLPLAQEAEVTLDCTVAEGTTEIVADARRIERVLSNLIQNAIKFSPGGALVAVQVSPTGDGGAQFVVEDEGPGVAESDLPYLFESAYQGVNPAPRPAEGHGLGLAIAQALARAHGGDLRVENRLNGGARFTLSLPKEPPAEQPTLGGGEPTRLSPALTNPADASRDLTPSPSP